MLSSQLARTKPCREKIYISFALNHLVDGDSVNVAVVDKPDDLVGEQLPVVLGRQVRLRGLGAEWLCWVGLGWVGLD